MRKTILLILSFLFVGAAANASDLRALNVQNAKIYGDKDQNTELRVNFDWFRDHSSLGGVDVRSQSMNMPRIDIRQSCTSGPIKFRLGLNTALTGSGAEVGDNSNVSSEASAFGFNNLGLTLEAGLVDKDKTAITWYLNQNFALVHNSLLSGNQLRPLTGANAYGFQTGLLYQFGLTDHLTWYGDVGYRFDVPDKGEVQNSLVYYNEAVWGLGSDDKVGIALGLLGNSIYNDNLGTDLRLVPGLTMKIGEGQLRAGLPLGMNSDSPDIGVQVSYFTML